MNSDSLHSHQALVQALKDPACYPHRVQQVELIETHISSVLLAGEFVYKIKKPVNFGFLDFSQLEQRRFFCQEELRLNARLAPKIYEDIVHVTGSVDKPVLNGTGEAIEYAVKMRRFEQTQILDHLLKNDALPPALMDEIALKVVDFHTHAAVATKQIPFGDPDAVFAPMQQNFDQLREWLEDPALLEELAQLEQWTQAHYQKLEALLITRKEQGFVRECHGDMHLANIAYIGQEITIFDGIEFNESFRWIDVANDVAFLIMDLEDRGASAHARRFLNAWLEASGDYAALHLLPFYQVYRAMVRAKVAAIRLTQDGLSATERNEILKAYQSYVELAKRFTKPTQSVLFITHGVSGSGKTTLTNTLLEALPLVRVRSDIERKRLAGLQATERHARGINQGIYDTQHTQQTYTHLATLATQILKAGYHAIVDATFLQAARRDQFAALAKELKVDFHILEFQADTDALIQRIEQRIKIGKDASDADLEVLKQQIQTRDALRLDEPVVSIDTQHPLPTETIRALL